LVQIVSKPLAPERCVTNGDSYQTEVVSLAALVAQANARFP
jgi:hypothetical protein